MPSPSQNESYLEFWAGGLSTVLSQRNAGKNQYVHAENIMIRGGVPQTRLGAELLVSLPGAKVQGFNLFRPSGGALAGLVIAVDGLIYRSSTPYAEFIQIPGIAFSPTADQIVFERAVKSVKRNADGSLTAITPIRVLVMQDGESRPAYWDGATARQLNPDVPFKETPTGLWMRWSGLRLWVARGNHVFASDIGDPLSFTESVYLAERDRFELPEDITGMIETSDKRALLVFTENDTTAFQSSILTRSQWQTTPDFQQILIPGVGCIAGKTAVNHFGRTWWFTKNGLVDLNAALFTLRDSKLDVKDAEMTRYKARISNTANLGCATSFENLLLLSLPVGDVYNAQTWVMDHAVIGGLGGTSPDAWASVWTGFRPVEWARGSIMGKDRVFFASYGATPSNAKSIHIWEAGLQKRTDNDNRIGCRFQTPLKVINGKLQRFKFAEIEFSEIVGNVELSIYLYGTKGRFILIHEGDFRAEEGPFGSLTHQEFTPETIIENYAPQTRLLQTKEPSAQHIEPQDGAESFAPENFDKAFGLLIEFRGRLAINSIKIITEDTPELKGGTGDATEDDSRIVTEAGFASEVTDAVVETWTSTQSYTAECSGSFGDPVTRTATYTSFVSQFDADAVALADATSAALAALVCYPEVWTSTQSYTASCAVGVGDSVTRTKTALSYVSQEDATNVALAAARAEAELALVCSATPEEIPELILSLSGFSVNPDGTSSVIASLRYVNDALNVEGASVTGVSSINFNGVQDPGFISFTQNPAFITLGDNLLTGDPFAPDHLSSVVVTATFQRTETGFPTYLDPFGAVYTAVSEFFV